MGSGAFEDRVGALEHARDARRVFCPAGLYLESALRGRGIAVRTTLPEEFADGDLLLLWGGPEWDDPWLRRGLAHGAEVHWTAPIAAALDLPPETRSRHAASGSPWPAAQPILVYGPDGVALPDDLEEAGEALLITAGARRSGPPGLLAAARDPGDLLFVPGLGDAAALAFVAAKSVMSRLRAPDGCPWDREQTQRTLLPYLLEEAAEAYDAILGDNVHEMQEELGDLLLQVLFHGQIGEEEGRFSAASIAQELRQKLRRRHPHVFGGEHYANAEDFLPRWEELKRQEGGGRESELSGIPIALSSLGAVEKALRRLHRAGVPQAVDRGFLGELEARVLEGQDLEAEVRGDYARLRERCQRAEAILGGRLSEFPKNRAREAWIRAE